MHRQLDEDAIDKVESVSQFEKLLIKFDQIPICFGFANENDIDLRRTRYYRDEFSRTTRHNSCDYTLISTSSNGYLGRTINCCGLCKNAGKAIRYLQRVVKTVTTSRKKSFNRNSENCRKRERRLRRRLVSLKMELKEAKDKIKVVNDEEVQHKIEKMNLSCAQKMLVMECIKMTRYKEKSSRRYSASWLHMCLLLHIKSPRTYAFLRKNEILPLPAISTVRKYLSQVRVQCGLDEEFFEAFKIKIKEKNEFARQGILIFDEMSVRVNIHLNVKTLKLVGIEDLGEQSNRTSKSVTGQEADHALVFMWSSLAENYTQPVAVYATKGPTKGTCLAQLVLEVVKKLENCGAEVHGTVCDGASTNRKMWSEFEISGKLANVNNKVIHPMDDSRYLYFFCDTPHLIKCLRNRFFKNKVLVVLIPNKI